MWVWCFPQMLVGFLVKVFTKALNQGDHYWYGIGSGSVSLGEYIFLCPSQWGNVDILMHEKGHTAQSRMLGWLYLPIVGIPSVVWKVCFKKYRKKHNVSYYAFYTESWADKLGGVVRKE